MAGYSTAENKRKTKELLIHYMEYAWRKAGLNWDSDNYTEVGLITEHIFDEMADLEARIEALEAAQAEPEKSTPGDPIRLIDSDPCAPEFPIKREALYDLANRALLALQADKQAPGVWDDQEEIDELIETATELRDWCGE